MEDLADQLYRNNENDYDRAIDDAERGAETAVKQRQWSTRDTLLEVAEILRKRRDNEATG